MALRATELPFLLYACAAALPLPVLCATAPAQQEPDAKVRSLLEKIDAARGKPAPGPATLSIEGTYQVTFEGAPGPEPVAKGGFRELYLGADHHRHTSDMGAYGTMERGITPELSWEVDPSMGAKVHRGAHDAIARRFCAVVRGVSPAGLYKGIELAGEKELDGRKHLLLRMTPAEGRPDTWYVDAERSIVTRIDTELPAPESADATFGLGGELPTTLTFSDFRKVGGVLHAHRRELKMGPATVISVCTKIEAGVKLEPAAFAPPEAVRKLKGQPAAKAFDESGKPIYQVAERQAQAVASIRLKIKPDKISATLAEVLPEVMAHLNATGARMTGAPFSRYHSFGETEIDLEAGIPVNRPIEEKGRVKNSELPAGKVVTAWHVGPYDKLEAAHRGMQAYVEANKLKVRGGCWEIYWTDPGMVPDPAKWQTQLFMPIE